jgi:site-specific recombinase XerD
LTSSRCGFRRQGSPYPLLCHLLHHTTATQYLANGGDAISLQRKLDHSGLVGTNRYVHLASDQLATIQERVSPMDRIQVRPMKVPKGR